jgi:large subunit ribosomal protein L17
MHRHSYKGRKLHRERDQREALVKGLADSVIKYESIETTLPKAKEVVPYVEKLITKAKKGDLHSRRQVISRLQTLESAHKLVDEVAPKLTGRNSGHLRIEKTRMRRGDNAQMARISFVDDLNEAPVAKAVPKTAAAKVEKAEVVETVEKKTPAKKANAKKEEK